MNMSFETLQSIKRGISTKEREYIIQILGKCLIEVKVMKFMKILFICISDPFYCFQVFTVVLWIYEDYSYYICGIVITTSSAIVLEVWSTLHSSNKIKKMAESTIMVNRMNSDGEFEEVESKYLAVGDILEIPNSGQVIPCDCILLSGDVIVNESVLTGESTTVVKSNIQENKVGGEFKPDKDQSLVKYILLTGTKIVQKRISKKVSHNNEEFSNVIDFNNSCLAYVYKTGYDSEKGNLIRSIVNPKDKESNFRRESLYFLFTMLSLVFCSYLILFPTITYGKFGTILVTLLDLSTIGAPPALPGYLGVSTVIALFNLRDNGILTIKRGKIFIASQVTYCVFDKTGTLTTDNLQKFGILDTSFNSSSDEKFKFDKFKSSEKRHSSIFSSSTDINELNKQNLKIIKNFNNSFNFVNPSIEISYLKEECLATCHTLSLINNEPTGDSLETEIFKDIDWELEDLCESKNGEYKAIANPKQDPSFRVGVIKQFEFSSALQRMGVITQTLENKDTELFKIYVKGSPEKILTLCKEDSIPSDFSETLSDYTSSGLRVIATACKLIKTNDIGLYTRNQAEKDLVFLGFYIVENKLKKETKEEINALKKAELKICMATGDNILTASYISQQCNIVKSDIITMELNLSTGDVKTGFFENKFDSDNSHNDFYISDETDITLVDDCNNYEAVKKDEENIFINNKILIMSKQWE